MTDTLSLTTHYLTTRLLPYDTLPYVATRCRFDTKGVLRDPDGDQIKTRWRGKGKQEA